MLAKIQSYLSKNTDSSTLSLFRTGFGLLMSISLIRFWYKGWIHQLYIAPKFHFSYYGFEWVTPLGDYTYILFAICILSSILITLGLKYRLNIVLFFITFTYIELMDKTTYLNHYYFISCLSFIMIFLPANKSFSIDTYLEKKSYRTVPCWTIDSIKLLIIIVFIYAGIAKINSDWLIEAMPLKIWLTSKYDIPILGPIILQQEWVHYLMSWGGMIYDLSIPILLLYSRTRLIAFLLVIFFHSLTAILFPIGMFPYIMIFSTIIFFHHSTHLRIINFLQLTLKRGLVNKRNSCIISWEKEKKNNNLSIVIVSLFLAFQILFPLRHHLYPGEILWKEEGYRFSWRVMLIEKKGDARFRIIDSKTKDCVVINNEDFLTEFQEKQMSFQADFILEYAHYLGRHYEKQGVHLPQVYVDCYVTLNGRRSQRYIDPKIDLYKEKESYRAKKWILDLDENIYDL